MVNRDEEFGYIKGKIETIETKTKLQQEQLDEIKTSLDTIAGKLAMYRHFIIYVRYMFLVGAFVITMKFGDIKEYFTGEAGE